MNLILDDGKGQKYTVNSAVYANVQKTSAVVFTEEAGAVAISQDDRPLFWEQLTAGGMDIQDMPEPTAAEQLAELDDVVSRYMEDRYNDGKWPDAPQEAIDAIAKKNELRGII